MSKAEDLVSSWLRTHHVQHKEPISLFVGLSFALHCYGAKEKNTDPIANQTMIEDQICLLTLHTLESWQTVVGSVHLTYVFSPGAIKGLLSPLTPRYSHVTSSCPWTRAVVICPTWSEADSVSLPHLLAGWQQEMLEPHIKEDRATAWNETILK